MSKPSNWWMYHGDPQHTGHVTGSDISQATIKNLKALDPLQLGGPILSVPALVDGYVYVGVANSHKVPGSNGGSFYKIKLDPEKPEIEATFSWGIEASEADSHGFTGMGCTPAVKDGLVYFSAFNGKLYCLRQADLELEWVTDLRYADPAHDQPVTNTLGQDRGYPVVAGWSSPLVHNGRVYFGIGEGENPFAYSFVYCLNAATGNVEWLYCTGRFEEGKPNEPNVIPAQIAHPVPGSKWKVYKGKVSLRGCSVWSSIAYDEASNRIYCTTGNPQPDGRLKPEGNEDGSNGILALEADTGEYYNFRQIPEDSSYRVSDTDVDIGGSPIIFQRDGRTVVGAGCKNGSFFMIDAETFKVINHRQLLPKDTEGNWIANVDRHPPASDQSLTPQVSNEVSNQTNAENYSGPFAVAALDPASERLFIGIGGPNYHNPSPAVDVDSTPFMRVMNVSDLTDPWPTEVVDNGDYKVERYSKSVPPMYTNGGESGLASPAVVNDLVFMSTTRVSVYAFAIEEGDTLWSDNLGQPTGGLNGGYGYCMGPAIWGNYVVAGGLITGRDGGILQIYHLDTSTSS